MPAILNAWLTGEVKGWEVVNIVQNYLNSNKNTSNNYLIKKMSEMIFIPRNFINTRKFIAEGVELLKQLKRSQKYKLFILSNWDSHSFKILKEENPNIFDLFDDVMVSGEVGLLKPNPVIYNKALEKFSIEAKNTLFIDDERTNIISAKKVGIKAIQIKKNYHIIRELYSITMLLIRVIT